ISGSIFPEKEIQQLKSIYTQNLRVNQEKTSFLASRLFKKTIYGEHHPYGKELNEEDVRRIDRNGLVQFYNKALGEFKVIVSGKIGAERKTKILDSFASLSNRQIEKTDHHPEPSPRYKHHADKENSIQSSLRVGKRVIGRTHPDYAYLLFVNHILGGYFGSRLMKNIREEKGLTYGIYSSIHAMAHDSYLAIGTDVNKENRELAFRGIKSEINRLSEEMISDEELETARCHFIGSFQTELSTAFAHADKIKSIVLFNLGKDHYNSLLEKINKATAEDLRVVAKKYLENNFYEISAG
ncbi:MAG TPA: insulinase family protein, partial [Cyclobacteriaceae bacterium]|nr:insulinase family protein [Cyclobacteriaceae bacterium]